MRAEHLHQWLVSATQYDTSDATNWQKVVAIMQVAFLDGTLSDEILWYTPVLIPKGMSRDFRGTELVEVLWKALTSLLN